MKRREQNVETALYPSFFEGAASQHFGRERSAMTHYRREIDRSGYWKAHFNLAWLLSQRRRFREAERHYRLALGARPPGPDACDAWANLGLLCHRTKRPQEALAALRSATRLAPRNPEIALDLATVYFETNRPGRGRFWLRKAMRIRQDSVDCDKLAGYLLIEYDVDVHRGVALLKRWLRAYRDDAILRADLAVAYTKIGNRRAASRLAKRAAELAASDEQDETTRRIVRRVLRKAGFDGEWRGPLRQRP